MKRGLILLGALAAAMASAPAAPAATPFTAGFGQDASLAVGADGSGHVVWMTEEANDRVGYCRVSAGAESCNRTELLGFGAATSALTAARPFVSTPAPNKVVIAGTCFLCPGLGASPTYVWTSTNNGASFGPPRVVTVFTGGVPISRGLWLDDHGIFVGTGPRVGATNGPTPATAGFAIAPGNFSVDPAITRLPGTNKLIAAANDFQTIRYAVYTGAGAAASINDPVNWLLDRPLVSPRPGHRGHGAQRRPQRRLPVLRLPPPGPLPGRSSPVRPGHEHVRRPRYLQGDDPIDRQTLGLPRSFQDPAGRIHLVWRVLFDDNRLRYRVSDPGAGTFTPAANLALRERFVDPQVAAGADGKGFALWDGGSDEVRVVTLDPQPEPAPAPQATQTRRCPTATGTASPMPVTTAPSAPTATRPTPTATGSATPVRCCRPAISHRSPAPASASNWCRARCSSGSLSSPSGFVPLKGIATVPVGSTVDASKGVVAVRAAANGSSRARLHTATIRAGIFKIRQARARARARRSRPTCSWNTPPTPRSGARRPTKRAVRRLTVVAKGLFRTFGGASTATARNATFTTTDRCDGTQTRVLRGRVTLKLKRRGSTVRVNAGRTYLAKARLFAASRPR